MRSVQKACALPVLLLACAACSLTPGGARLSTPAPGQSQGPSGGLVPVAVTAAPLAPAERCGSGFVMHALDHVTLAQWGLGATASGRGMSMADLNNDGRLDIVVNNLGSPAQLFENQLCGGESLEVDLAWPQSFNSRAIGTRLVLHTSMGDLYRDVRAASGYLSGDPSRIHFGFLPDSMLQRLDNPVAGRRAISVAGPAPHTLLAVTRR
jgi:hypothetical protein